MTDNIDKPLFRSLDQALRWAWRHEPRMVRPPAIMQLAGRDDRDSAPLEEEIDKAPPPRVIDFDLDPKPSGIDAAGQQGLLKSFVYRQPDPERLHLISKYAFGDERKQAQRALRDYLIPLVNNIIRPRYVIFACVSHFYGSRITLKDMAVRVVTIVPVKEGEDDAARMREAWRMVRDLSHDVDNLLRDVATRTEDMALSELKARGVIS